MAPPKKTAKKTIVDRVPKYGSDYSQIHRYGFKFTMLDEKNKVIFTPSTCKDYIQDIFWAEITNNSVSINNIIWKKGMLDAAAEKFKLLIMGGEVKLNKTMKYLEEFLHYFEDAQGIPRSKIRQSDKDTDIIIIFDRKWAENGPLLSTFTTLVRIGGAYVGGDPLEYLKGLRDLYDTDGYPEYMNTDIYRLTITLKKFAAVLAGKKVVHSWTTFKNTWDSHNIGICGFTGFPTVSV